MKRFACLLLLTGCGKPDVSTPEGFVAQVQAELRAENWGGVFDLLGADGRTSLDQDMREILATAKDASKTGVMGPDLRDAYIRMMKASTSSPS